MNKSIKALFIVIMISLGIAFFWDRVPIISDTVHGVLDPSAGVLLERNVDLGIVAFAAVIGLFITIIQKYTTDQETLREIKKEKKHLKKEKKNYKDKPEKQREIQKRTD